MHTPVLQDELLNGLAIENGDTVVDATLGEAGYLLALCEKWHGELDFVGIDADPEAIARAKDRFAATHCRPVLIQSNFRRIRDVLVENAIGPVQRVMFDLGLSSYQIDASERGFSFRRDEPLDMRFGDNGLTAREIVNGWSEKELADTIYQYGEERFARRIARGITQTRNAAPIETTSDLVNIIYGHTPKRYHHGRLHPATRTFQALRIAVNDELNALREGLVGAWEMLASGGRIAVISFHSLEDRIVKQQFRQREDDGFGRRVTKKPIRPSENEREHNTRARSAKLRIVEKS